MSNKRFTIKETDIFKYIVNQMNDNSFNIKFGLAEYMTTNNAYGEPQDLLIYRLGFDNMNFDETVTFDEETYQSEIESFVAMNVGALGGEFTALKNIQQASYSPLLSFLVPISNPISEVVRLAIEEVRSRLKANLGTMKTYYHDLNDVESDELIEETLKIATNVDSIDYGGQPFTINGRRYLEFSFSLYMLVQNIGDFGNQMSFELGQQQEDGTFDMKEFQPLTWDWGLAYDNESVQVLREYGVGNPNQNEVKAVPKTKSFAITFEFILDLKNELHREFYKLSLKDKSNYPIYNLIIKTSIFDDVADDFVVDDDLTSERIYSLEVIKPSDSISVGEQIMFIATFLPHYITK